VLRRKEVSAVLVGATKPEQVVENAKASDVNLSKTTLDEIEAILDNTPVWPRTYRPNVFYEEE
ncbi:MAG: hypothetical protein ACW960_12815, partial [Candidatus Thorarchaeota archaeon]